MTIRALMAVTAVAAAVALTGCGTDRPSAEPTGAGTPTHRAGGPAGTIQLRQVISSDPSRPELAAFTCPTGRVTTAAASGRDVACDDHGKTYLLAPAAYDGQAASASAVIPDGRTDWAVNVQLDAEGARALKKLSTDLVTSGDEVALVIDGVVVSSATFNGVITDGSMQITGGFTEKSPTALADRLS